MTVHLLPHSTSFRNRAVVEHQKFCSDGPSYFVSLALAMINMLNTLGCWVGHQVCVRLWAAVRGANEAIISGQATRRPRYYSPTTRDFSHTALNFPRATRCTEWVRVIVAIIETATSVADHCRAMQCIVCSFLCIELLQLKWSASPKESKDDFIQNLLTCSFEVKKHVSVKSVDMFE